MELASCQACDLHLKTHNVVPGEGPVPARIMIVGEAPGDAEDRKGRPFYGPSGVRLSVLLKIAGLNRDEVYITNLVKHRPPKNRKPKAAEIKACQGFLIQEIADVQPEIIIPLGLPAIKWFDKTVALRKDHGWPRPYTNGILLVPNYHPAASLYDPKLWPLMLDDWKQLESRLAATPLPEPNYSLADDIQVNEPSPAVGFDLETSSTKRVAGVQRCEIVGFSVSAEPGGAQYCPRKPRHIPPGVTHIVHNAKFEWVKLHQLGIELNNFEDTKLAAYLLGHISTGLKDLTRHILGRDPITYEQATQGRDMSEIPPTEIVDYAAADSDHTRQLWHILGPEMDRMELRDVYERIEKPLIPILARAELRGVAVDRRAALRAKAFFAARVASAQRRARESGLPRSVSIGSRDQLARWLEDRGAPITTRTPEKRLFSTDYNTLVSVRESGWEPQLMSSIMDFFDMRRLQDFPTTFLKLSTWDGALHGSINQAGHMEEGDDKAGEAPATGRMSMTSPNLTQIPHHGLGKGEGYEKFGMIIRKSLIARPGFMFVAADFSQQEPRVLSYVASELRMQADFAAGIPIYAPMGEAIYGRPIDKSHKHEWHVAKTFFLAKTYGADWTKLVEIDPLMSKVQARAADAQVTERYPGLAPFGRRVALEIREHGYARDYFGRIRWFPGVFSLNRTQRAAADRAAVNMHIQGPAASITKLGIQKAVKDLASEGIDGHFLLPIHDEALFEIRAEQVVAAAAVLREMSAGVIPVPMPIEIQVGPNLGEMEPYA